MKNSYNINVSKTTLLDLLNDGKLNPNDNHNIPEGLILRAIRDSWVRKIPYYLKFVKNPSEKFQEKLIKIDASFIKYIKNPTDKMKIIALNETYQAHTLMKKVPVRGQHIIINNSSYLYSYKKFKNSTEGVKRHIILNCPKEIRIIKNPSKKLKMLAIKKNPYSIQHIKNPSKKMKYAAIRKNPRSIFYFNNPSKSMILLAIKRSPDIIEHISNPTLKMQWEAVKRIPYVIKYLKTQPRKLREYVVYRNPENIKICRGQTKAMKVYAKLSSVGE